MTPDAMQTMRSEHTSFVVLVGPNACRCRFQNYSVGKFLGGSIGQVTLVGSFLRLDCVFRFAVESFQVTGLPGG